MTEVETGLREVAARGGSADTTEVEAGLHCERWICCHD